jgi:hypothetical protein
LHDLTAIFDGVHHSLLVKILFLFFLSLLEFTMDSALLNLLSIPSHFSPFLSVEIDSTSILSSWELKVKFLEQGVADHTCNPSY